MVGDFELCLHKDHNKQGSNKPTCTVKELTCKWTGHIGNVYSDVPSNLWNTMHME